jgi:transcriptional regulator with XRE-family HTH domain
MDSSRNRGIPVKPEKLVFIEQKMREIGIDSREKLAELAGMSEEWIRKKLFAGKNVERKSIEAISRVLGVEPTEIIEIDKWHPQSKSERAEASRNIDWYKICCDVLEIQQKQLLTSYLLGAADRRVRDVYVPLGLIERQVKPRVEKDLDPTNWSVQKQEETIKPVSHQNFFESVLKGQSPKSKGKRIAIIGEPGAGKTTLLQEICSKIDGVPIWIDLASLKKGDVLEDYLLQKWLKSYLSVIQKYAPAAVPDLLEPSTDLKKSFTNLFTQSKVWLLLDGADEMASELRDPLNWVAQGLQNSAWVANARVVLTSRLNIWSDNGDRLGDF